MEIRTLMAWNEPGGSKDPDRNSERNPWGKRPQQGPPDLDEVVRNLKRKFNALFGGGGGGGGGNGRGSDLGSGRSGVGIGVLMGGLLLVWLITGFYQVGQAERAVVLRFGKYLETTQAGLKWRLPWPIDSKTIVNIERIDNFSDQTRMLTSDENMVDIKLDVQFRRADPKLWAFNVRDPEATLREVSESAIRETIGRSTLSDVLGSGRQEIAARTKELIQRTLDIYETGILITTVNLPDVLVPEQVAPAQQDAIKAGKDKERFVSEAQTYANDILPKARGAGLREVQDAQAYRSRKIADSEGETARFTKLLSEYERAPGVTRERLYLETIESVFGGAKKVIIDTKGSSNMLYVPIDKLIDQSRSSAQPPRDSVVVTRAPASTPTSDNSADDRRARGTR
ncbi:MAG: FtsH protease activity modulator HflK [Candidatus Obscuribacterales bacterium]|nr:FtsH protease activity modulator HflK [Steroidobacteraceae bacterium]